MTSFRNNVGHESAKCVIITWGCNEINWRCEEARRGADMSIKKDLTI